MRETNKPQIEVNTTANEALELIVNTKPVSRFVTTVLFILTIMTFSLPILIGGAIISSGSGIRLGIIIAFGLFMLVGVFLYRAYLWNAYGREVFVLKPNSVKYYCDYKRFQERKTELEGGISYLIQKVGEEEREDKTLDSEKLTVLVRLGFLIVDSEFSIDSQIDVPETLIRSVMEEAEDKFGYLESIIVDVED